MKIDAEEAKFRFEELVRRAEAGEIITITLNGKPIGDLVKHVPRKVLGTRDATN